VGFAGITGLVLICRLLSANGQRTHMSDAPRFSGAYLHLWRAALKRLFMDSGGAFGGPPAQSGLAVKCLVAAPYGAVGHVRPTRRCRPDKRDVVSRLSGPRKQGLPSGSARQQAGAPMGSWHRPGTHGTPRQRRCDDPQGVAVLSGGCLLASRPDRTNKDSLLGSKQVDPWVRGIYHESIGFLRGGSAMTRKPRPAGSDRQVRCSSPVHPDDRSRLT
jgi:hypothetical protein